MPPALLLPPVAVGVVCEGSVPDIACSPWWQVLCLAPILLGIVMRAWIVGTVPEGTSGRNTQRQVAEELNTTGAYSVLRHPLYMSNALMWAGVLLRPAIWWLWLLGMVVFIVVYERIMLAEEFFLHQRFGERFREWAQRTPAVLPQWDRYRPPARSFQWGAVLLREYSTWLAVTASFAVVEALLFWRWTGQLGLPLLWWCVLGAVGAMAILLRFLKRRARLFRG
ncbi:MAG: isoprenylcysteine carboxylmethyltransferase family protein [Candidatus Kapabacteria bacterium]|nr:isoprenylcysteine carboxylmethyltransferase family protein [Candidatus Kapabacteria bacterium]